MSELIKGSCLCGRISFEYSGELGPLHCVQCRKSNGTAFAANSQVEKSQYKITSGEVLVKEYESTPGKYRAFCGNCGSPIYSRRVSLPDKLRIRLGLLDGKTDIKPSFHIFTGSKADWYEICDELPQYEEFEPGR